MTEMEVNAFDSVEKENSGELIPTVKCLKKAALGPQSESTIDHGEAEGGRTADWSAFKDQLEMLCGSLGKGSGQCRVFRS
ncbi:hypothetical protein V3C99_003583 [Haemonchus contortus]